MECVARPRSKPIRGYGGVAGLRWAVRPRAPLRPVQWFITIGASRCGSAEPAIRIQLVNQALGFATVAGYGEDGRPLTASHRRMIVVAGLPSSPDLSELPG